MTEEEEVVVQKRKKKKKQKQKRKNKVGIVRLSVFCRRKQLFPVLSLCPVVLLITVTLI
jgi:hypothetical protein